MLGFGRILTRQWLCRGLFNGVLLDLQESIQPIVGDWFMHVLHGVVMASSMLC